MLQTTAAGSIMPQSYNIVPRLPGVVQGGAADGDEAAGSDEGDDDSSDDEKEGNETGGGQGNLMMHSM